MLSSLKKYISLWRCLPVLLVLVSLKGYAQQPHLQITAGTGVTYIGSKSASAVYQPIALPNLNIAALLSLSKFIAIRTGLNYQKKGWHITNTQYFDDVQSVFSVDDRYQLISIPLELSFRLLQHGSSQLCLAGGLNYGFLIHAKAKGSWLETGGHNQLLAFSVFDNKQRVNLFASASKGTDFFLFNPAARLDATYIYKRHYLVSAFYEYNIQTMEAYPTDPSSFRLHYLGISLGYGFY